MKKIWIIVLLTMFSSSVFGQVNLVPNPSFEDTVGGTPCYGPIEGAKYWFNPQGATPDYYTYFPGYCTGVSSVNNPTGFQLARTGNAYAAIYGFGDPTREYIAAILADTLLQGECYYVEFYVSLANLSRYAIDNLGCYFTNDTAGYKTITTNIPVMPQVLNQQGNFLSDTMSWQKVSGSFTAAGGEFFILIGNFFDGLNTTLDTVLPSSTWQAGFYYIDDLLVTPCDSVSGINSSVSSQSIIIYPVPAAEFIFLSAHNINLNKEKILIYDMEGRNCTSEVKITGSFDRWKLNISNLSKGIYNLSLTNNLSSKTNLKLIKQ